jgi:hypothetical protein
MKLYPLVASLAAVTTMAAPLPSRFEKPRVAIIISHDSFKQDWNTTQMSGHAWGGAWTSVCRDSSSPGDLEGKGTHLQVSKTRRPKGAHLEAVPAPPFEDGRDGALKKLRLERKK